MLRGIPLLLIPTLASAVELQLDGECPGTLAVSATGVTPGGSVFFVTADMAGTDNVPQGSCTGTPTGLDVSAAYGPYRDANNDGVVSLSPNAGAGVCGKVVKVLDVSTCTFSEPEGFLTQGVCPAGTVNAWRAGGIENGLLASTETSGNGEAVTSAAAASGTYSVELTNGSAYVEQTFSPPVPVSAITTAGWQWSADPTNGAISFYEWSYSDGSGDNELQIGGWTGLGAFDPLDLLAYLDPNKSISRLRIYGYSGGGPLADILRIDNLRVCY